MRSIITNKAQCLKCGDIVESIVVTLFKKCECGNLMVGGGKEDLLRQLLNKTKAVKGIDYVELSTFMMSEETENSSPTI